MSMGEHKVGESNVLRDSIYKLFIVCFVALISLFVFWSPFLFHIDRLWGIKFGDKASMQTIVRNFDGLNFLIVEKSGFYDVDKLKAYESVTDNTPIYFTAHYPGYAVVLWLFDMFTTGPNALLLSVVIGNVLLGVGLYVFFSEIFKSGSVALYLSIVGLFLPARVMSVRGVGSTETYFMFFTLMSFVFFMRKKHWIAGLLGAMSVLFRSPGILLFFGYALFYLLKYRKDIVQFIKSIIPYSLIPLSLVVIWLFYGWRYGDFFAYFNSGDNMHLFFPPFQVFSNMSSWVSGMWREDVVWIYLAFSVGLYMFWKNIHTHMSVNRYSSGGDKSDGDGDGDNCNGGCVELSPVLLWGVVYFGIMLFVSHRDVSRYILPISPVALAGYGSTVEKNSKYKWLVLWLVVPVLLFSWNFVLQNVQPVSDWSLFL